MTNCPCCGAGVDKGNQCSYCGVVFESTTSNKNDIISSKCLRCGVDNSHNVIQCKSCNFPIQLKCPDCSEHNHIRLSSCHKCGSTMNEPNSVFETTDKEGIVNRSLSIVTDKIENNDIDLADYYLSFAWNEEKKDNSVLIKKAEIYALFALRASYDVGSVNVKMKYIKNAEDILKRIDDHSFDSDKKRISDILDNAKGKVSSITGKDGVCFIATATMGDYDHPVVMQLREFRDQYLLERNWGKKFTRYYYRWGPYPAKIISKSNLLKKVSYVLIVQPLSFVVQKIMNKKE